VLYNLRVIVVLSENGGRIMKILFINPNTSKSFTEKIQAAARQYALTSTQVEALNPPSGPRSIESIYDELLSAAGTLELAISVMEQYDAFVIACYSDHPTVYALREITDKPVLGIAEASMYVACMVGHKFSVVTTNREWEPLLMDAVRHYGLAERCASVRSTGMPVLDGVVSALKLMEGLVGYNLRTSKRLAYSQPGPKELPGLPPIFSRPYKPI
jgi:Asp/Glu/hydantoin racemase